MLSRLRRYALLLVWVPFTFSLPGSPGGQGGPGDTAARVDQLFAPWNKAHSPGCAVAVLQDGKVIHQRGYGMANLEHAIPITPATVFNIASVSKQFTVFLIMLLVTSGQLGLDDDVRTHVPELHDFGKKITVRHLIHHTSGLREDWSLLALAGWRTEDVVTQRDVLDLVYRQKELNFAPGSEYLYCNTGYMLLGKILEKVGGKSQRQLAQERIFAPLGMTASVFQDDHRMLIPKRALSYRPLPGGGFGHFHFATDRAGPSNLYTTVEDLARWDRNFYDFKIGGKKAVDLMLQKFTLSGGKEIPYAGGLVHSEFRGLPMIAHTGSVAGYRSILARFPQQRFSVIILANVSSFNTQDMARKVAEIYLEKQLGPAPPEKKLVKKKPADGPALTAQELATLTGAYHSDELDTTYRLLVRDGRLFLRHRKGEALLLPQGQDRFRSEIVAPVTIQFVRQPGQPPTALTVSTDRARNVRFHRLDR
jgi:CubicO group peptidase (beta-lactamase class C family)